MHQAILRKGPALHVIRWQPGDEAAVMDAVVAMIGRDGFDWFDAACLSYEVGKRRAGSPAPESTPESQREAFDGLAF